METAVRRFVSLLSRTVPKWGVAVAEALWFRARGRPMRPHPKDANEFGMSMMGRDMTGYTLGEGDVVLLLHGWGGAASDMNALAVATADAGYCAVVPNLPGHGPDRKARTDLFTMAAAVDAISATFGEPQTVIAHSFGAPVTFAAFPYGGPAQVVLIAPALRGEKFYEFFVRHLGLGKRAERIFGARFERFAGPHLLGVLRGEGDVPGAEMLVLHDPADDRTAYSDSAAYVGRRPSAELRSIPGAGHKSILADRRTIDAALTFLAMPATRRQAS